MGVASKINVVLEINDNETGHDANAIADDFNNFFTNIAANLVRKLPSATNINTAGSEFFKTFYYCKNSQNNSLSITEVSV